MVRFKKNLLKKAKFLRVFLNPIVTSFLRVFLEPYSDPIFARIYLSEDFFHPIVKILAKIGWLASIMHDL